MASNEKSAPVLKKSPPEIAERGAVRLGSSGITADFPPLRVPDRKISEAGSVRLGSSGITATFPSR